MHTTCELFSFMLTSVRFSISLPCGIASGYVVPGALLYVERTLHKIQCLCHLDSLLQLFVSQCKSSCVAVL